MSSCHTGNEEIVQLPIFSDELPTLVVTDLDGTLINDDNRVTRRTKNALEHLISRGVPVILATGRPPRDSWEILDQLPFMPWCICANGAVFLDSSTSSIEVNSYLTPVDISLCIRCCRDVFPELGFAVEPLGLATDFLANSYYVHPWPEPLATIVATEELALQNVYKILISVPGVSSADIYEKISLVIPKKFSLSYSTASGLVEISLAGVNKAAAVRQLAHKLNYPYDKTLAFGDMRNDRELLLWAWCGVAMGNADAALRAATPWSTMGNNSDGVARAIEKIWNFSPPN